MKILLSGYRRRLVARESLCTVRAALQGMPLGDPPVLYVTQVHMSCGTNAHMQCTTGSEHLLETINKSMCKDVASFGGWRELNTANTFRRRPYFGKTPTSLGHAA